MAKKKAKQKPNTLAVADTAELVCDADNPRTIGKDASKGLANSLERFGDLSGLVFNQRTGELVCGHQRMTQIREKWGDQSIDVLDIESELGCIRIDAKHTFSVRVVDWSPALQRAANVAANNQEIAGTFTDDLSDYLLSVQADLQEESPGLLDEVMLVDLMDIQLEAEIKEVEVEACFQVIVDVEGEGQQKKVYDLLEKEGWKCRVLTV